MIGIARHIEYLLLHHGRVTLPGIGTFAVDYREARLLPDDSSFLPPVRRVEFYPDECGDDERLLRSVMRSRFIFRDEAARAIADEADAIRRAVEAGSDYRLGRLGRFVLHDGQIDFWAFDKESILLITVYVLCYFLSYWLIYAIFGRKIKKGGGMRIKSLSLLLLIGAGLIVDIVLNSVVIYSDMSFENSLVNYITNLMCCILLLYSQFGLLLNKELEGELQTMQQLLNQDKEQYASLKENIDLINMKCHDMRHQIREIGISKSLNSEVIDEMEKSITLYDTMVKTGNEALDVILSEKSLLCYRKGIVLTCVADGGRLDFMSATDLYSLFGNALDNAIEAVMKIDDPDGRIIGLRIHAVGQMVTINLKNSFVGEVELDDDGFPVTTKEDKRYHGFGLKSIRYVVEKYDGSVAVQVEDGMFNLNVLVPLPSQ